MPRRATAAYTALAVADTALAALGHDRLRRLTKPLLMPALMLLAMSLVALDSGSSKVAAGGALFLASDSLLALEKFANVHLPAHHGLVMATYTSAAALLAD